MNDRKLEALKVLKILDSKATRMHVGAESASNDESRRRDYSEHSDTSKTRDSSEHHDYSDRNDNVV